MSRILFFLLSASVTIQLSAVSFEDSNFRVDTRSDGFFEQKNPDATIADAANLARKITLEHLKPRVDDGKMTTDDLKLLHFCLYVMGKQVEQTYEQAAHAMGLDVSGRSVEYVLNDTKQKPQAIRDWQKINPLPSNSNLRSFASSYNPSHLKNIYQSFDDIKKMIDESRENESEDIVRNEAEDRIYAKHPEWSWWDGARWWDIIFFWGGIIVVIVAVILLFIVLPAGVVGLIVGGVFLSISLCTRGCVRSRWLSQNINVSHLEERYKKVGKRSEYLPDIFANSNSIYRRTYMDLAYVAALSDRCYADLEQNRDMEDLTKVDLKINLQNVLIYSQEKLSDLERIFVTYPLMLEFVDLTSVNRFLWHLKREVNNKDKIEEYENKVLDYKDSVKKMGTCYVVYSTEPICRRTLKSYNNFLKWAFSTNYNDRINITNSVPWLIDEYEKMVNSALIDPGETSRIEVMMAKERINENKYLKDVVGGIIGGKDLDDWCRQVEKMNERNWLYPTWCDEIEARINPPKSEDVVRIVRYYRNEDAGLWVKTVAEALLKMTGCSDEMKSLMEIVCDEDELDEMKDEILDTIDDRKLTAVVEQRINNDYGSQEKMVESWLKILSDKSMPDVSQLQSRIEKDILGHWKMIRECEEKSWWNPSRWF